MKRNSGLTLLEITIGLFLIGSAMVVYLKAIESSGRKNKFYSDHFIASILTAKVVENCYQEVDINPYGLESLGLTNQSGKNLGFSTLITDGQTVFFQNPSISEGQTPDLFNFAKKDYQLKIDTDDSSARSFLLDTELSWPTKVGGGSFKYSVLLPKFNLKNEAFSSFAFPESELEDKVVERIFEVKGKRLSNLVHSASAEKLALSTGRIYFSCSSFLYSDHFQESYKKAEEYSPISYTANPKKYDQATEQYFNIARDLLDLMLYLKPDFEVVKKEIDSKESLSLRNKARLESFIFKSGYALERMRQLFFICVNNAVSRYKLQIKECADSGKQRRILRKSFNIYRILYCCKNYCNNIFTYGNSKNIIRKEYFDFLTKIERYFEKKDPAVFRLSQQERIFAKADKLQEKFFPCKVIFELFESIESMKKVLPELYVDSLYDPRVLGKEAGNGSIGGAITWARDQLSGGSKKGKNLNTGKITKDRNAWTGYSLSFIATAYGKDSAEFSRINQIEYLQELEESGKIKNDKTPPPGAIMFFSETPENPNVHVFMSTGKYDSKGDPFVITSGWPGSEGVREVLLSELIDQVGEDYYRGWKSANAYEK